MLHYIHQSTHAIPETKQRPGDFLWVHPQMIMDWDRSSLAIWFPTWTIKKYLVSEPYISLWAMSKPKMFRSKTLQVFPKLWRGHPNVESTHFRYHWGSHPDNFRMREVSRLEEIPRRASSSSWYLQVGHWLCLIDTWWNLLGGCWWFIRPQTGTWFRWEGRLGLTPFDF